MSSLSVQVLQPHVSCALCQGLIVDCWAISECLHSFCKACLFKHVHSSKEVVCPVCRESLGCHPLEAIRPDHIKQSVLVKLMPWLMPMATNPLSVQSLGLVHSMSSLQMDDQSTSPLITFQLRRRERQILTELERPFIKTENTLTVFQVRRYVMHKLNLVEQVSLWWQDTELLHNEQRLIDALPPELDWTNGHVVLHYSQAEKSSPLVVK